MGAPAGPPNPRRLRYNAPMAERLTSLISEHGYWAISLLMLLENVFPPIPSELIMPFAGAAAAEGDLNPVLVALAGTLGSLAGAVLWYFVGLRVGTQRLRRWCEKHGRWLTLSPEEVDQADAWFDRRGHWAVLFGRMVPAVRTLVSVPAGLSEMRWITFLAWSAIGTLLWTAGLTTLGYFLGKEFGTATRWIDWLTYGVLALALGIYLWRVATFRRKSG